MSKLVVRDGSKVEIRFKARIQSGDIIDSEDSLQLRVNRRSVLRGLFRTLLGMRVGERKSVRLEPEEAYGPFFEDRWQTMPVDSLPSGASVGDAVVDSLNEDRIWWVREIKEKYVVLDSNHPFAGETLDFDVEVLSITI